MGINRYHLLTLMKSLSTQYQEPDKSEHLLQFNPHFRQIPAEIFVITQRACASTWINQLEIFFALSTFSSEILTIRQ